MKRKKIIKKLEALGFEIDDYGIVYISGIMLKANLKPNNNQLNVNDIKQAIIDKDAKEVTDYLGLTDKEQSNDK